ncbi:MAG: signal peptidase I [Patescibacteria group bacterium]|nr:signal peptidase I [Patescibacteria group bacterium]
MNILRKIYYFLLDTVQTFLIAAAVFLVIYVFLFRPFEVKGESMYPNFYDKEYVLTNLIALHFQNPARGDVVVFKSPPDPEKDYIKRVIGLPGDKVSIKDGNVYINGELLDESAYIKPDVKTYPGAFLSEGKVVEVPGKEYFVLGDNRLYSSDSREWGFVKQDAIIGDSMFVYWPLNRMRVIKNPF